MNEQPAEIRTSFSDPSDAMWVGDQILGEITRIDENSLPAHFEIGKHTPCAAYEVLAQTDGTEDYILTISQSRRWTHDRIWFDVQLGHKEKMLLSIQMGVPAGRANLYTLETLEEALNWLTVRPGDTDEEFFNDYTQDAREWAESYECECMTMLPMMISEAWTE